MGKGHEDASGPHPSHASQAQLYTAAAIQTAAGNTPSTTGTRSPCVSTPSLLPLPGQDPPDGTGRYIDTQAWRSPDLASQERVAGFSIAIAAAARTACPAKLLGAAPSAST